MRVMHIAGARPNFMKVAPVMRAFARREPVEQLLVHTGQHYDRNMSDVFFEQLDIPRPDMSLGVGSGTHAVQTARIMMALDDVLTEDKPDLVLVYGDVNSTAAAALVCAKLGVPVGHVEAGLRSFDRTMPEELNRRVTDQLSDILFTPSPDGDENLLREGIDPERIFRIGNVMIDTLHRLLPHARRPQIEGLSGEYALVTLHRAANVDDPESLTRLLEAISTVSRQIQTVFVVHPRTRKRIDALGLPRLHSERMLCLEAVGYLEFLGLQRSAKVVITDSGGIQEETTVLGVPCLTLRENTERPVTVSVGTNQLIGKDMKRLTAEVGRILDGKGKEGTVPELWDGQASQRLVDVVLSGQGARADRRRAA